MIIAGRLLTTQADPAALPVLFWLHHDLIVEKIQAAVDAIADDAHALTLEQRAELLGQIDVDRLAVEREEEHFLTESVAGGANVLRRPDADPRAVLGLDDGMPTP